MNCDMQIQGRASSDVSKLIFSRRSLIQCGYVAALFLMFMANASAQVVPLAQHVVLVIDENTSFNTAYPNGMPWLVSQGNKYAFANNYVTEVGGSLLEYLYLASGSCESNYQCGGAPSCSLAPGTHNFFCNGNSCYVNNACVSTGTKDPISDENIFHLMNNSGISWKVYVQNYLNAGGNVNVPDFNTSNQPPYTHYYARHNAAVWYDEILKNVSGSQGNVVDFEQFGIDVAQNALPRFSIIVPDGCWDAHESCGSSAVKSADSFLQVNLTPVFNLPDFKVGGSGLLIVTFDNGDSDGAGKVYTAVMGPNIKPGYVANAPYTHQNTLRTMLDALGISTYPGWSASAVDMADLFLPRAGGVTINSPAAGSVQGPSVLVRATASELSTSIDHIEVWDLFKGIMSRIGSASGKDVEVDVPVAGNGVHILIVKDVGGPNLAVLHRQSLKFTESSNYGVAVTTPADQSTQAQLFPLTAFATELGPQASSTGVDHLEVWNGPNKIGDSPKGASLSQWYSLSPGSYNLTVQDVSATGTVLHKSNVGMTISSARGVFVNSPANGSTWPNTRIQINAYAYEQSGSSTPLVDHIEVWDTTHGVKLGESVTGVGVNSLFINQTITLPKAGVYQLAISDINANGYAPIHTANVTITVK